MALGPDPMGPLSRNFYWACQEIATKTGAAEWVQKFWIAADAGQGQQAAKFLSTIRTVINAQKGTALAAELTTIVPEMEAALAGLGVTAELAVEVPLVAAEGAAGAALSPWMVAAVVALLLFYGATRVKGAEMPKQPPRQLPPNFKDNPNLDPVARLRLEGSLRNLARHMKPRQI